MLGDAVFLVGFFCVAGDFLVGVGLVATLRNGSCTLGLHFGQVRSGFNGPEHLLQSKTGLSESSRFLGIRLTNSQVSSNEDAGAWFLGIGPLIILFLGMLFSGTPFLLAGAD